MASNTPLADVYIRVFDDIANESLRIDLRVYWLDADQARREVSRLDEYADHWVKNEQGDLILWPAHTNRMDGGELVEAILQADQQANLAERTARDCAMELARHMAKSVHEQSHLVGQQTDKVQVARAVVQHLEDTCRPADTNVELFPVSLRP